MQKAKCAVGTSGHGEEKDSPTTDSKEPGRQGQRGKGGILWIRQAGIHLPEKTAALSEQMHNWRGIWTLCQWPGKRGFRDVTVF
jgi:hypothetical protein